MRLFLANSVDLMQELGYAFRVWKQGYDIDYLLISVLKVGIGFVLNATT